jgi:hypothetical protein
MDGWMDGWMDEWMESTTRTIFEISNSREAKNVSQTALDITISKQY